jgi:excisionase family DNA binding protein
VSRRSPPAALLLFLLLLSACGLIPGARTSEEVMEATIEREWLTVPQVAEELQIPRTRAYELIQRGGLPGAVRISERSIRVNRRELERFPSLGTALVC